MSFAADTRSRADKSGRFSVMVLVMTALFLAVMGRLFYLQIVRGEQLRETAVRSFIGTERIPARRGLIKDAQGKVLADNQPAYLAQLLPRRTGQQGWQATVASLSELLHLTDAERAKVEADMQEAWDRERSWDPVLVPRELVGEQCPHDGALLEMLEQPVARLDCAVCGVGYEPIEAAAKVCPHDKRRLKWHKGGAGPYATCARCGRHFVLEPHCPDDRAALKPIEHNLQCPVCKRSFVSEVAMLRAALYRLPGVDVKTAFRRVYPFHYEAAHTLGFMNRVRAEERAAEPGVYGMTDIVGRRGLEWSLEKLLRGEAGESRFLKGVRGNKVTAAESADLGFERAVNGFDLHLTVDMRMQQAVKDAFRYYKSGAAVVLDPRTGAILGIYSKPGFDPNVWSGRLSPEVWKETIENPYTPLIHKAVTPYHPGSVYKIVTATAGLDSGLITPDLRINCPGHYDFAGRRFHCHHRSGHGHVDLLQAIKYSCDVYFYKVGEMLGIDMLARYGKMFGFGSKTGVEVPEREGIVPTKQYHRDETKLGWQPGFALSTAIGQGALTASTLQVARAYAALVNGGNVLRPRLIDRYVNDRGETVKQFGAEPLWKLPIRTEHLALVREGLVRVINDPDGTGYDSHLESMVLAGKTGTAEAAEWRAGADDELRTWLKEDHAWFATYAPAEDPQVVVVVFVEHGGSGSKQAAPIAVRIINSWLKLGFYQPAAEQGSGDAGAPGAAGAEDEAGEPPAAGGPAEDPAGEPPAAGGPAEDPAGGGP
jgi:penicillin-binding protein 2